MAAVRWENSRPRAEHAIPNIVDPDYMLPLRYRECRRPLRHRGTQRALRPRLTASMPGASSDLQVSPPNVRCRLTPGSPSIVPAAQASLSARRRNMSPAPPSPPNSFNESKLPTLGKRKFKKNSFFFAPRISTRETLRFSSTASTRHTTDGILEMWASHLWPSMTVNRRIRVCCSSSRAKEEACPTYRRRHRLIIWIVRAFILPSTRSRTPIPLFFRVFCARGSHKQRPRYRVSPA